MTATVDKRRELQQPRFSLTRRRSLPAPLLAAVVFLVLWEVGAFLIASTSDRLAPLKLPYPHEVLRALIANIALLLDAALDTAIGALIVYLVGTVVGVAIGSVWFLIAEFLPLMSRLARHVVEERLLHRALK